jgi:hypothetical protein
MKVSTTISIDDEVKKKAQEILKRNKFLTLRGIQYPSVSGLTEEQLKQAIEESQ